MDVQLRTAAAVAAKPPHGDPDQAVAALFTAHYARLVRLATFLVDDRGTAEDVVMDAYAALHRRWRWFGAPDDAFHYLQTSVVNGSRSKLRRLRLARERDRPHAPESVPSAEASAIARIEGRRLLEHTRRLPTRQRQVIVCRYYLDMTEEQIAVDLGISRGSVKKHASRAIAALSALMKEEP
ncbi:MAG: SigE family RNA polymerase sigma factor [Actinomycetes bacterium]